MCLAPQPEFQHLLEQPEICRSRHRSPVHRNYGAADPPIKAIIDFAEWMSDIAPVTAETGCRPEKREPVSGAQGLERGPSAARETPEVAAVNHHRFLSSIADYAGIRWGRLTLTAIGGIAALLTGIALLLEDEGALFAPVFGMAGGHRRRGHGQS
jgi:hypothetical protein